MSKRTVIKTEHPEHGLHYWHYDPAEQKDMDEHTIRAWPIGGGFAKGIPKSHVTDWNTTFPRVYKAGWVGFGDFADYGLIPCYLNPHDSWNGWAKPMVDAEGLKLFLARQQRFSEKPEEMGTVATGRMVDDAVIWHDPNYTDDEDITITPEWIDVEGGPKVGVKVWDISLGLTWDEFSAEEREQFLKEAQNANR